MPQAAPPAATPPFRRGRLTICDSDAFLLHHGGESWAEIGAKVGQRNLSVTADTYSHALFDYREIDRAKLLERARIAHTPLNPPTGENGLFAGTF